MILEVVILDVRKDSNREYEAAFREASPLIAAMKGYIAHELRPCLEKPNRYILLVKWETLEAHMAGFRNSPEFQKWRALLHHFYEPAPTVEHYGEPVVSNTR